mgnify:FL=1|tara:strand:- start:893 stop:1975 length:1083 start_codon:yes stop_codon:yes gene_type:complete
MMLSFVPDQDVIMRNMTTAICLTLAVFLGVTGCQTTSTKNTKYIPISVENSKIILNVKGYQTNHMTKGWNEAYTRETFRAVIKEQSLYIKVQMSHLVGYRFWSGGSSLKSLAQKEWPNRIVRFTKFGSGETEFTSERNRYDTDKGELGIKFEVDHPDYKFCYLFKYAQHWGSSHNIFNPVTYFQICTKEDLKLSVENPRHFFTQDDDNQKVRINIDYQGLGQKISLIKSSSAESTSTAKEIGKSRSDKIISTLPRPTANSAIKKRPIAINWAGKSQLILGEVELPVSGSTGKASLSLPDNAGECFGTFSFKNRSSGVWALACSTGETISGTFIGSGKGSGFTGSGTDGKGGEVKFTIGPK